jgi:hypothetical protein
VRKPPAYQRYPADVLGPEAAARLTLAERGLLASMQDAAWLCDDCSVPADAEDLAMVVRRPVIEVRAALTASVLGWFDTATPGRLIASELRDQKDRMLARRVQLSQAGRKGATNKHGKSDSSSAGSSHGSSGGSLSTEQHSSTPIVGATESLDPFVQDIERAEVEQQQQRVAGARRVLSVARGG